MKKFLVIALTIMMMMFTGVAFADNITNNDANSGVIGDNSQSQSQGQTFTDNSITDMRDQSVHEAADLNDGRGFANPGGVAYGPVLNYFGQPLPSEGFQPIEQLLMYVCFFTEGSLESMLKGVEDAEAEFKVANRTIELAKPAEEDGETRWIKIVIQTTKYEGANVDFRGFITARSDAKKTTMTEVMAKAALTAIKNGCNVIHFTAQGAVRDVMSSGWGIGFNTTQAQVYSSDFTKSNVSSGGMGYSSARAGVRDLPWLQGFGLVDHDLVYPAVKVEAQ